MSTETLMADAADNARYLYATALQTERTPDAGPVTMTVAQARDLAELLAALAAENAALREALRWTTQALEITRDAAKKNAAWSLASELQPAITAGNAALASPGKGDAKP